jgi:hypothetical protein
MREREALQKRINGEDRRFDPDAAAPRAGRLDGQLAQRAELARASERFDAEHTRISYTL